MVLLPLIMFLMISCYVVVFHSIGVHMIETQAMHPTVIHVDAVFGDDMFG